MSKNVQDIRESYKLMNSKKNWRVELAKVKIPSGIFQSDSLHYKNI